MLSRQIYAWLDENRDADHARRLPRRRQAARHVGKGLVDRNPLDQGREIADYVDGGVAQLLVFLEMPADKSELRTELARVPSQHAAADPEGLGLVRSGKHNPTTDGDGFAAQRRVNQLLYRGIESIQVRMEDGGCRCHPDRSPATFLVEKNIMRTWARSVKPIVPRTIARTSVLKAWLLSTSLSPCRCALRVSDFNAKRGFMVRSEGDRICCDINELPRFVKQKGAFQI